MYSTCSLIPDHMKILLPFSLEDDKDTLKVYTFNGFRTKNDSYVRPVVQDEKIRSFLYLVDLL